MWTTQVSQFTKMTLETLTAAAAPRALDGIVVLDLSGALGNYCGKLFADLGADVILVEPPAGAPTRRMHPTIEGRTDADASLLFRYNNANKRGMVIDLDTSAGQDLFRTLAARAHLVIETERPGVMAARGLGHADLRAIAPHLVMTSITPFGQTGPYAQWEAEDIVGLALGGMLYLAGYPDGPPMAAYGNQAYAAANLFGAVASMAAVYDAEVSLRGQHVDVSTQECVVMGLENAVQFFDLEGTIRKRNAGQQRQAGTGVFDCADGSIYLMAGGIGANRFWGTTVQWLIDEGVEGAEALKESCWTDMAFLTTEGAKETFGRIFLPFSRKRTKLELYTEGQKRRIPIAPISNTADIVQSRQLRERDYFIDGATITGGDPTGMPASWLMPGAPFRLSATPWSLRRPAPALGQHTREILNEFGVDAGRQVQLFAEGIVR
jgi:benzylsuccinate CoA-transferase BbsE subunit